MHRSRVQCPRLKPSHHPENRNRMQWRATHRIGLCVCVVLLLYGGGALQLVLYHVPHEITSEHVVVIFT